MNRFLLAIVSSALVFGSATAFAADSVKKEDLTTEQRVDMRNRADQLTRARAQAPTEVKTTTQPATRANLHHVKKAKKLSPHEAKKVQPKA